MKKLVMQLSNKRIITSSGLSFVEPMLGKSDRISISEKCSQPQIKNKDIILTHIGDIVSG